MTNRAMGEAAFDGDAVFECPNCGSEVRTETALIRYSIEHGMHYQGVRCSGCGDSFTAELTESPRARPD